MVFQIPETTRSAQALASDPYRSSWVSANAGSGKTFVLSQRVIRLLLAGTDPSRILCLTFTKAAAAEMANRVFQRLSEWTSLDDTKLGEILHELEGRPASDEEQARARRLFARALETPGGLKIQTIHAFAERLLHQFPLEANVPAHFEILDEQLAAEMLDKALGYVLTAARTQTRTDWTKALDHLIGSMGDMDIRAALASLIRNREGFGRFIESSGANCPQDPSAHNSSAMDDDMGATGIEAALSHLAATLGIAPNDSLEALQKEFVPSPHFSPDYLAQLADLFEGGGKRDKDQAALLRAILSHTDPALRVRDWLQFFRKKDGAAKSLSFTASKKMLTAEPSLEGTIAREQDRLDALAERRKSILTLAGSRSLFILAEGVIGHYERAKTARGLMDFDDLIIKAADLLKPVNAAAWVHYKLDQGIDHILVDEAQDTNPRQWEIIQRLGEEFFVGDSQRATERTIFAVGDEKQSIYSFQGAEPKWFADMRSFFAGRAEQAQKPFHKIDLQLSFRSTPHILKAVDQVFSQQDQYHALTADNEPTVHEAIRHRDPGLVELWPLLLPSEQEEQEDWAAPLDAQTDASPPVQLARDIAATIKDWIDRGEHLAGSGKRITPGDVLILVRKRGGFVNAVNRALKEAGLPVAGADRLALLDHIAIMDLLSLGDVMLLPQDDLSLACVLKSPLFDFSEDQLFELAKVPDGAKKRDTSLWDLLRLAYERDPQTLFGRTFSQLREWQKKIDFQPPFDFYAQLLGPGGKRAAFIERLGPEADEVIDELLSRALDFEKKQTPNLQAFLAAMRQGGGEIKRDMGAAENQIRVMTVHGSKGLEAPIVFLVDGTGKPANPRHHPHLVTLAAKGQSADLMAWKGARADQPAQVSASLTELDQKAEEEYLRLLYVGMTRAEDRLYLCGYTGKSGPADKCWYNIMSNRLKEDAKSVKHPVTGGDILRWELAQDFSPREADESIGLLAPSAPAHLPDWFHVPADAEEVRLPALQPSKAADLAEERAPGLAGPMQASSTYEWEPRRRGTLLHTLFEHLPMIPQDEWQMRGLAYLARLAPDMEPNAHQALLEEALSVLQHPDFSALFDPSSQAEVSLAGWVETEQGPRDVSGQVDRLVIKDDTILVLDYKTNRQIPQSDADIPTEYQIQMALYAHLLEPLYPGKALKTILLWTSGPELREVSAHQRQNALDHIGVR
ncbi:MAG: double-strand break repair helicase AddA [Cohaesibacter sp.]|jgi:ATP-dependent helicase/nuclease subunit A|nr:double-strand break repair helicase AddA [Cohaesibacter sp.]